MKSKSQRFSETVFPRVQAVAGGPAADAKKYKTLSKKAGSLVRNSGLMQTLAFFMARGRKNGEEHHQILLDHLQEELRELGLLGDREEFYETTRAAELPQYMVLTRETLLLLNWHKRLAEILIQADDEPQQEAAQ